MAITDLINYAKAIKQIESSGGNYGAQGPVTRNGDRAYGAYQVMGNNVPSWTQKHFGQSLTPDQFLHNAEAQDAVFNGEFGGYVNKYGNPQDAASMWFSGRRMAQAGNRDDGYNTVPQYIQKFNKALGQDGGGGGALSSFADEGGSSSNPALAAIQNAAGQGNGVAGNGVLFQGEQPNKLHGIGSTLANVGAAIAGISNPQQANSLRGIAQGIEAQATGEFQYQMGPNGQLIRINKRSGTVDSIGIPGGQRQQNSFKHISEDDPTTGYKRSGVLNEQTGEIKWQNSASAAPAAGADTASPAGDGSDTPPHHLGPDAVKLWRKEKAKLLIDLPNATNRLAQTESGMDAIEKDARTILDSKYIPAITGSLGYPLPGTPGGDLNAKKKSLISKLTLDTLTDLRNASKTGGAVGNASDTDMKLLGTKIANLETAQTEESLKAALQDVITFARESKTRQREAYYQTYPNKRPKKQDEAQQPAKSGGGLAPGWSVVTD
jgi:hypothetical protein